MSGANDLEEAGLVEYQPESRTFRTSQVIRGLQVVPQPRRKNALVHFFFHPDSPTASPGASEDLVWELNQNQIRDLIQQLESALQQIE